MKPDLLRKIIGGLSALLGIGWLIIAVMPVIAKPPERDPEFSSAAIFMWAFHALTALFGIVWMVASIRLYRSFDASALKWSVGAPATVLTFLVCGSISSQFSTSRPEWMVGNFLLPLAAWIAVPVYMTLVWHLMPRVGGEKVKFLTLLNRGYLVLMAFLLWLFLSGLQRHVFHLDYPWSLFIFLVTISVPICLYKIASARLLDTGAANKDEDSAKVSTKTS